MDSPVVPAASLILMRPGPGDAPEILFVERARTLRFGGGAIAFPGGRIDPGDEALAARLGGADADDTAARLAAIRELREETAIAIGGGDAAAGLALLAPFARWCPPAGLVRRFDTRFYIADAPEGARAVADGSEIVRAMWETATAMAARIRDGDLHALFPTRRLIDRLALFADREAAAADRHSGTKRAIHAQIVRRGDDDWLRIPDDAGYPVVEERLVPGLRS